MILAASVLLLWAHPETGADVYNALQERFRHSSSLEVTEGWDTPPQREVKCKIIRPNRASKKGLGVNWWTDGKRTVENDDFGKVNRRAKPDDLKSEMRLVGFESFYDPKLKVSAVGDAESVSIYSRDYLAIALKIDSTEYKLYLDPKTRLPVFFEDVKLKVQTWYSDVRLGPTIKQVKR